MENEIVATVIKEVEIIYLGDVEPFVSVEYISRDFHCDDCEEIHDAVLHIEDISMN